MQVMQTIQTGECGTIIDFIEVDRRVWKKQQEENLAWFNEVFGVSKKTTKTNTVQKRSQGREGTKLQQAITLFQKFNGTRDEFIQLLESNLHMSKQGATTYYYLVKKAV